MPAPTITRRFPDVQVLLMDALADFVAAGSVAAQTPVDLEARMPFIRVRRTGGSSDRVNVFASVDIDVFAATYAVAEPLAEDIRQWLCGPPPPVPVFDRIECTIDPRELPWSDGLTVRRWGASYLVTARRVPRPA